MKKYQQFLGRGPVASFAVTRTDPPPLFGVNSLLIFQPQATRPSHREHGNLHAAPGRVAGGVKQVGHQRGHLTLDLHT